ncbi:hypothetical protein Bca52824_066295 [Brassica carinata]|uniref:Uncharacterized protein n=1 Tax=Brassica carinata TaxID=52824 RepID=A0A8X7U9Y8_BRACI|nr:hypothetical protein Bca52824_066295 [Brassica carinata]
MAQHWPKLRRGPKKTQTKTCDATHVSKPQQRGMTRVRRSHTETAKENHAGDWTAFHRTSPKTEWRFTGPRREQALTQTHHFITFACFHRRASDEKSRPHPETKPSPRRLKSFTHPSYTIIP